MLNGLKIYHYENKLCIRNSYIIVICHILFKLKMILCFISMTILYDVVIEKYCLFSELRFLIDLVIYSQVILDLRTCFPLTNTHDLLGS